MHRFVYIITAIILYVGYVQNTSTRCVTPNSEEAECVSLFSCNILQQALGSEDETAKQFVKASKCGDDFQVCCGTFGNFTNSTTKAPEQTKPVSEFAAAAEESETRREYVLKRFLPMLKYCGYQHSDDYYNQQNETGLDEFPWLVHFEYRSPYARPTPGTEFKCAGVLLSNELVLTSHACAKQFITYIKIGVYNKHLNSSCISTEFGPECTDLVQVTFGSRMTIPNSNLMLVRLIDKIKLFSDYVRPICLPFEESQRPAVGATVYTSGWGEEDTKDSTIQIKKRVVHKVTAVEENNKIAEIKFTNNGSSADVCEGDEGGPLMYPSDRRQWFLAGLITETPCNGTIPAVANALNAETMDNLIENMFYFMPHS